MKKNELFDLTISEVLRETENSVSIGFEVPQELIEKFQFLPGQHLALETEIAGEKIRRSYSLCSAPYENKWRVAVKKVSGGKFSTFANDELKASTKIRVMPPHGNFKLSINANDEKNIVAFAAGSGITPIISMVKTVLQDSPNSTITLFYGNRSTDEIIFREELENLKNKYLDRFSLYHILSKEKTGVPLLYGRIDDEKCKIFSKHFYDVNDVDAFYLCGPAPMIFTVSDELKNLGVQDSNIHFELFNTDGIIATPKEVSEPNYDPATQSKVTLIMDGEVNEFPLAYGGNSILEAALKEGMDLPFACKGGVCSTCKAKITAGEVDMDVNYALEPDELERGFVLTCQSHPRTSNVTVNFDEI